MKTSKEIKALCPDGDCRCGWCGRKETLSSTHAAKVAGWLSLSVGDKVALWCGCDKGRRASKKDFPDRVTFRLGSLRDDLATWCLDHGMTSSQAVRHAVAEMLKVEAPAMDGNLRVIERVNSQRK